MSKVYQAAAGRGERGVAIECVAEHASWIGGEHAETPGGVMTIVVLAVLIGVVAGLRSMTAPAAISWGARFGLLHLDHTPLSFLGSSIASYVLSVLALGELVVDQLPKAPSRKTPGPFGARILTGGLSGAAIGAAADALIVGLLAGVVGAIAGTLFGAAARGRLARAFHKDTPAAFLEDAVALGGAVLVLSLLG